MKYETSLERLILDRWYKSGFKASVDWVAGGNFDGYLTIRYLKFLSNSDEVEMKIERVCGRGYELGTIDRSIGKYGASYKGSIFISFENLKMNGYVLGDLNEFLAFESNYSEMKYRFTEGYELV